MISMTLSAAARPAMAPDPRGRADMVSGLASLPSPSQRATPIRTEPTSTASRTPTLNRRLRELRVSPRQRYGCSTVSPYATRPHYVPNDLANGVE